jgi:hypothetical protein
LKIKKVLYLEFSPIHDLKKKWTPRVHTKSKKRFAIFWVFFKPNLFRLLTCSIGASSKFSTNYFVGESISFSQSSLRQQLIWEVEHLLHLSRFLSNNCPFLLEVISAKSSSLLPIQAHLRMVWELLPLDVVTCILLLCS